MFGVWLIVILGVGAQYSQEAKGNSLSLPLSDSIKRSLDERSRDFIHGIAGKIQVWQHEYNHHHHRLNCINSDRDSGSDKQDGSDRLPFVLLTYAQSLDGKIAALDHRDGTSSSNLPISGKESLYLTHALRSIHDAILVGGKTMLTDNPRLTNRLWGNDDDDNIPRSQYQPRPVILDPDLKYMKELGTLRRARNVIVCCSYDAVNRYEEENGGGTLHGFGETDDLTLLGCRIDNNGQLDLEDLLGRLSKIHGIRSIMVEGGSRVISSFVSSSSLRSQQQQGLVHGVCVTISPKLIGQDHGVPSIRSIIPHHPWVDMTHAPSDSSFIPLGKDCILLARWP